MQYFHFICFLLSPFLVSFRGENFCSSVAPTSLGHISFYTLWILFDTSISVAIDVTEDRIKLREKKRKREEHKILQYSYPFLFLSFFFKIKKKKSKKC